MDNGNQKNLVSQALVNRLNLVTTPHPHPYQLGWVQKDGPHLLVSERCLVTFAIGQFKDIVLCDVSPLDCSDLLLGIPYQSQTTSIYMAKHRQYKISKDSHTYILTTTKPKTHATTEKTHVIADFTTPSESHLYGLPLSLCKLLRPLGPFFVL